MCFPWQTDQLWCLMEVSSILGRWSWCLVHSVYSEQSVRNVKSTKLQYRIAIHIVLPTKQCDNIVSPLVISSTTSEKEEVCGAYVGLQHQCCLLAVKHKAVTGSPPLNQHCPIRITNLKSEGERYSVVLAPAWSRSVQQLDRSTLPLVTRRL